MSRDCDAVAIPGGQRVVLPKGTEVRITQALGGAYTVLSEWHGLLRIEGQDADALGEPPTPAGAPTSALGAEGGQSVEQLVWQQLKTVYDPEIPVNVVDLGLVYDCQITATPGGGSRVAVKMTLTAPGCGMGDYLKADAQRKLSSIPGVQDASVELVLEPPWNQGMMSEAAKLQLGLM